MLNDSCLAYNLQKPLELLDEKTVVAGFHRLRIRRREIVELGNINADVNHNPCFIVYNIVTSPQIFDFIGLIEI